MATKARKKTAFQKMKAVATKYCAKKANKTDVTKAVKAYKASAEKAGKTPGEANAIVSRALKCPTKKKAAVSGVKRKKRVGRPRSKKR